MDSKNSLFSFTHKESASESEDKFNFKIILDPCLWTVLVEMLKIFAIF
jgi:hypothetical protein